MIQSGYLNSRQVSPDKDRVRASSLTKMIIYCTLIRSNKRHFSYEVKNGPSHPSQPSSLSGPATTKERRSLPMTVEAGDDSAATKKQIVEADDAGATASPKLKQGRISNYFTSRMTPLVFELSVVLILCCRGMLRRMWRVRLNQLVAL